MTASNPAAAAAGEPPLDLEPAPVANAAAVASPAPAQAAAPNQVPANDPNADESAEVAAKVGTLTPPTTATAHSKPDIASAVLLLHWVGYDYLEREALVRIEMVTVAT